MSVTKCQAWVRYLACPRDLPASRRYLTTKVGREERGRHGRLPLQPFIDMPSVVWRSSRQRSSDKDAASMAEETDAAETDRPSRKSNPSAKKEFQSCGEAIRVGLDRFREQQYSEALDAFNASLELPGEGRFRFAGKATEFSGPSQSEEHAALYNIICCYGKMGEMDSAMICLEALLDSEFEDFETLRNDPDLADLRTDRRFEEMIQKFDSMQKRVTKIFQRKPRADKPWLL